MDRKPHNNRLTHKSVPAHASTPPQPLQALAALFIASPELVTDAQLHVLQSRYGNRQFAALVALARQKQLAQVQQAHDDSGTDIMMDGSAVGNVGEGADEDVGFLLEDKAVPGSGEALETNTSGTSKKRPRDDAPPQVIPLAPNALLPALPLAIETQPQVTAPALNALLPALPLAIDPQPTDTDDIFFEDENFWAKVTVRSSQMTSLYEASQLTIHDLSISPARRPTQYGAKLGNNGLQGGHLVAWSAMLPYWSTQLCGDMDNSFKCLSKWLLSDHIADRQKDQNYKQRARAHFLIDHALNNKLTIDAMLDAFEEAFSLFIVTNQFSSFAVAGSSKGSQSEKDAVTFLENANETAEESPPDAELVKSHALKLIDKRTAPITLEECAKAVFTWYTMLCEQYSELIVIFDAKLLDEWFWYKSVEDWLVYWKTAYSKQKSGARKELDTGKEVAKGQKFDPEIALGVRALVGAKKADTAHTPLTVSLVPAFPSTDDTEMADATGATSSALPATTSGNALTSLETPLHANEVQIPGIEIPPTLRAKTQFFPKQESHTLAWTYKIRSLTNQLKNKTASSFLKELHILAADDLGSVSENKHPKLKTDLQNLCNDLVNLQAMSCTLRDWNINLQKCLIHYIEFNQLLPSSTFSGADQARGHAEAKANEVFQDKTSTLKMMQIKAPAYVDLGFFYNPMLLEILEYKEGKQELDRTATRENTEGEPKHKKPRVDLQADKHPALSAADCFVKLFESKALSSKAKTNLQYMKAIEYHLLTQIIIDCNNYLNTNPATPLASIDGQPNTLKISYEGADKMVGCFNASLTKFKGAWGSKRCKQILTEAMPSFEQKNEHLNAETRQPLRKRINELEMSLVSEPAIATKRLFQKQKSMLGKIIGDFYLHLPHFHSGFYAVFSNDINMKKAFLKQALLAPLAPTDLRVGASFKMHLEACELPRKTFTSGYELVYNAVCAAVGQQITDELITDLFKAPTTAQAQGTTVNEQR